MSAVVSYLLPSYNHGKYLPFLLNNISLDIQQLDVPAEVIIIDDGSKDDSVTIIKAWAEAESGHFEINCIFQENKGIAAVLNTLIDKSSGQYLRLCASDDIIAVGSTQRLLDQFANNTQLLCVLADAAVINEDGHTIHPSSIVYHGGTIKRLSHPDQRVKELIQHWCVAGPTHLIKKSHYNSMRYNENETIDDYDLFLSLLKVAGSVAFINEIVCSYRIHSTNTSKTKNTAQRIENIESFLSTINRYLDGKILVGYLLPIKYKTLAKIDFLQKKYLRCSLNMIVSLFFKFKSEMMS